MYGVRNVGGRWEEVLTLVRRFQLVLLPGIVLLVLGGWLYKRWRAKKARRA